MPVDLSPLQREKLPRKLEECQKRIVVLQNQNEQLCKRLQEYQNPEAGFVKIPSAELQRLKTRDVLMDQNEVELQEIGKLNQNLQRTVEQLRNGKVGIPNSANRHHCRHLLLWLLCNQPVKITTDIYFFGLCC
jgi:conjugal transfer/entry exclusion protein